MQQNSLIDDLPESATDEGAGAFDTRPLADRLRPETVQDIFGQGHLLDAGKPLRQAIEEERLYSMVLWGPPGCGKTTFARLVGRTFGFHFVELSAVLAGVKDVRHIVSEATARRQQGQGTILFVDEIHRFNKSQQDAFLPHVEAGTIIFVGATTENPSFQLNNALLSRVRVYVLKSLDEQALILLLQRALTETRGLGGYGFQLSEQALHKIAVAADGDARRALTLLEIASDLADELHISDQAVDEVLSAGTNRRFDNRGDEFYDQISALHKSVRGSDPDAALYWFARMIDAGCDPQYIARRLVRMATEDIGNADPRALALALQAWQSYDRLGSPEGELVLAQATLYLAVAAKSNAAYVAYARSRKLIEETGSQEVPLHIRNAPTNLMKDLGYADGYRYAHDEAFGYAAGETYLPEKVLERIAEQPLYEPVDRGLEIKIKEKLAYLKGLK